MSDKEKKITKESSFRQKISKAFATLLAMVFSVVFISFFLLSTVISEKTNSTASENSRELSRISAQENEEEIEQNMNATIIAKAENANTYFGVLYEKVVLLQQTAQYLYSNPKEYGAITVQQPKNTDKLSLYVTYASGTDPDNPKIQEEQSLIGNLSGLLSSIKMQDTNITSDYIATESGIMIQVDELAHYQVDENGNALPFDAKERIWYKGAVENPGASVYFSDAFTDAATGKYAIVASATVFNGKQLKGVVGAGMLLEDLDALVEPVIENGTDFIVDSRGVVINSSASEGELLASRDKQNNSLDANTELENQLKNFIENDELTNMNIKLKINGEMQYLFCAKISSVGWVYASAVPESVVNEKTQKLVDKMSTQTITMLNNIMLMFSHAFGILVLFLIIIMILSTFIAKRLTNKLVSPIKLLSGKVQGLNLENLEFEWNYHTGDEIDLLAIAFCELTERIHKYIKDITAITAEKERIGAELSVATQIQADMLPIVFPPFPERNEFEIYASMTPAKEVGGDFYDFFMLDDDHLVMVIGDVSGKGVPAALFMVISKTLIKDHAQMCGSPKAILEEVNNLLLESNAEGMFVTIWLGILEISTGKIVAANAGHEYPAIQSANGEFELLKDKHGMMVGAMSGIRYKEYEIQIEKGGCLFVYTDGVPEATNANNELYGTDRMILALNQNPQADPKTLLVNVRADVDKFVGDAPQFDDLTMLSIRYFGKSE